MVPSQRPKRVNYILNCLPFDSKPTRFYKTETLPTFNVQHPVNSTSTNRQFRFDNYLQSRHHLLPSLQICHVENRVNRVYILVVLRTKKELPVLECIDKDKNSCQYTYEYDPVASIILPPERPYRWYRTTTYTDNNRADIHTIH